MQLNLVVSTNTAGVRCWQRNGFKTVGNLPGAFHHPRLGFVDALVMVQQLALDAWQELLSRQQSLQTMYPMKSLQTRRFWQGCA